MDRNLILKLLSRMTEYISDLQSFEGVPWLAYSASHRDQMLVERALHLLIESACSINTHLLVDAGFTPPDSYADSFKKAAEHKFISTELSLRLVPSAKFRNVLVHRYVDLDGKLVYDSIPHAVKDYRQYMMEVTGLFDRKL